MSNPMRTVARVQLRLQGIVIKPEHYAALLTPGGFNLPNGLNLTCEQGNDEDTKPPWEEHDGHGIVLEGRSASSHDELKDSWAMGNYLYYDIKATTAKARKERWGLGEPDKSILAQRLGRKPTRKEILDEAVSKDYEYCKGWVKDEWGWCFVRVALNDAQGNEIDADSLGGLQSNDEPYLAESAANMANQLLEDRLTRKIECDNIAQCIAIAACPAA